MSPYKYYKVLYKHDRTGNNITYLKCIGNRIFERYDSYWSNTPVVKCPTYPLSDFISNDFNRSTITIEEYTQELFLLRI